MKRKQTIVMVTIQIIIGLIILLLINVIGKTKTVSVIEDGIKVTITVKEKRDKLIITSKMKNTTKKSKEIVFSTPCNRGIYYHTSENFKQHYHLINDACIDVLGMYEIKSNEVLINEKEYIRKKSISLEEIFIYPGREQEKVKIKM